MFITLISQIPICESDIIFKNRITIIIGIIMYLVVGGLIFTNYIPEKYLNIVSDYRYLIGIILIDIILYIGLHRFTYGCLPQFFGNNQQNGQQRQTNEQMNGQINRQMMNEKMINGNKQSATMKKLMNNVKNQCGERQTNKKTNKVNFKEEETSVNLDDDLESSLKKRGVVKISDFPDEVSVAGKNYFKDDESRAIIENWEIDEYTNEEFVN